MSRPASEVPRDAKDKCKTPFWSLYNNASFCASKLTFPDALPTTFCVLIQKLELHSLRRMSKPVMLLIAEL